MRCTFSLWAFHVSWFVIGMAILGSRAIVFGAAPSGWSIQPGFAPLVGGWIGLAILAAATHLLPAIGPCNEHAQSRQRSLLGTAAVRGSLRSRPALQR